MRVLIASSATGGHIYPALAVADMIMKRDPDAEILFVGAKWEIGKGIVEAAGYRQVFIDARGFDRRNIFITLASLIALTKASAEARKIISEFGPDVCIGTGGHVAGPVVRSAKRAGIRTMIQEQNVVPGLANKLAERYAERVFVGFSEAMSHFKDSDKVKVSGNPVRADFMEAAACREEFRKKYDVPDETFCVLIFGGSQGAEAINKAAVKTVERLCGDRGGAFRFILITGRDKGSQDGRLLDPDYPCLVMEYSKEIWELFAAADLIIARSGALTVSEITQSGRASILIPSPNVTNNHQYYNAKVLADAGASVLISEEDILEYNNDEPSVLTREIIRLAGDPGAVAAMGKAAALLAKPEATKVIVDEIFGS